MDNKEIIINSVNVVECKYFLEPNGCDDCNDGMSMQCDLNPDCYYKQLAREKQKNIGLEDLIKLMREDEETYLQEYEKLLHTKDKLEEEKDLLIRDLLSKLHEAIQNNKYEQALKEIRDSLDFESKCGIIKCVYVTYAINLTK